MTTQQPAALWIAYELEIGTFVPNVLQNEICCDRTPQPNSAASTPASLSLKPSLHSALTRQTWPQQRRRGSGMVQPPQRSQ